MTLIVRHVIIIPVEWALDTWPSQEPTFTTAQHAILEQVSLERLLYPNIMRTVRISPQLPIARYVTVTAACTLTMQEQMAQLPPWGTISRMSPIRQPHHTSTTAQSIPRTAMAAITELTQKMQAGAAL